MRWIKRGLIFSPSGELPWMRSHAQLPTSLYLKKDVYRVYFASRDHDNRSHVCYVDIDFQSQPAIRAISDKPVLAPGPLGFFDDHGVYPASIVNHENKLYLYYIGWNPGKQSPLFYSSIGLAISEDGGETFYRYSSAPIMARSQHDPCLVTSPCVLKEGRLWRMWYVSGFKWEVVADGLHSFYHIKYAESEDGVHWKREGRVSIDLKPGEKNIARPCVRKADNGYKMWYSHNIGQGYRIGYAESVDGYDWIRLDEVAGIDLSASGWDSEALAYPWVLDHKGKTYLLYNGNGFGRDGFGLAEDAEA